MTRTDRQHLIRKKIIQDIANIYFNPQENDSYRSDVKDDYHNMFVEVIQEIHDKYKHDKWLAIYNWLKQLKGDVV